MQARAFGQPRREPRGQVVGQRCGVGIQVQGAARTLRERLQFAAQLRLLLQDQACMVGEGGAGFGQADAARVPVQQRGAGIGFDRAQAFAGRTSARFACAAPAVMLPASAIARNRRRSAMSIRMSCPHRNACAFGSAEGGAGRPHCAPGGGPIQ
jgi:hypothetical protein